MNLLLNNQWLDLANADGRQPLLSWLREDQGLCATKEGCGSGDCGACTVVVGRWQGERMHYQSVNACIALLGSVHGCHLMTLEGLSIGYQAGMHPVQQALVEHHASQCGFCTPGIVMAMLAWWLNTPPVSLSTLDQQQTHRQHFAEALSGNLCRCTGYQPIFKAADALAASCVGGNLDAVVMAGLNQRDIMNALTSAPTTVNSAQAQTAKHYWQPHNEAQLALAMDAMFLDQTEQADQPCEPEQQQTITKIVAGSTDLGLEITQQQQIPTALINVTQLPACNNIIHTDGVLTMGAAVTFSQLEAFFTASPPTSQRSMPAAWLTLLPLIGSRQVRNLGTLGGNIANASPIADTPPLLLALNATLQLQQGQQRRRVPIAEFYQGYKQTQLQTGELIRAIEVPFSLSNTQASTQENIYIEKISKRKEDDIASVCIAMLIETHHQQVRQCRIGLGGVAATPVYAQTLADYVLRHGYHSLTEQQVLALLANDIQPLSDARASANYRLHACAKTLHYWLMQEAMV